jgi:hypothetical protein
MDERVRLAGDGVRWVDTSGDSIDSHENKTGRERDCGWQDTVIWISRSRMYG